MLHFHRIARATGPRVGIAGSLTGRRVAHLAAFHTAFDDLERSAVPAWLGDDASTPEQALALAREFERNGVRLVIGHFNSACARAVMPFYRAHCIELLLPAATDVGLALGTGVYRLCANDAAQACAISDWLRSRATHAPAVEVRVDGSDYAERLLQCLRAELGPAIVSVLGTADPAPPSAPFCVVLAVAHQALDFIQRSGLRGALANGGTVFSDEAAVSEVSHAARRLGARCWVITPNPSYEALLIQACRLAAQWHAHTSVVGSFAQWVRTEGLFLPSGEARHAAWTVRDCAAAHATHSLLAAETQLH